MMSLAGLFLCVFLLVHLGGNLLLFKGDNGALFNRYSDFMENNIIIRILEVVLFLGIIGHILVGIVLTLQNKSSRPIGYAINNPGENSSWFSRNMGLTGFVIFIFLSVHLKNFMIDQRFLGIHDSMYESVKLTFGNTWYFLFYLVTVSWLGFHLAHGFQSAFQSIGMNHPKWSPLFKIIGILFSCVIPLGFIAMPVYFYLKAILK